MATAGAANPSEMPDNRFRTFLSSLPARAGYCVDCLSRLYEEPAETIGGYLGEIGIIGRQDECGNCGERKEIFRDNPSS
jgi:hypothetical protein